MSNNKKRDKKSARDYERRVRPTPAATYRSGATGVNL